MSKEALVKGYAEALFAVAEAEGSVGAVEDELFAFAKAIETQPKLRDALTDPQLPAENKKAILRDLLGGKATPHTVNILGFLIEQGRARDLGKIIEKLAEVAAERRQHALAEVRSAIPLTDKQRKALEKALSRATGRDIEVKVFVDPTVVGGVVARIGDEVFDGSVRSRLEDARTRLAGA